MMPSTEKVAKFPYRRPSKNYEHHGLNAKQEALLATKFSDGKDFEFDESSRNQQSKTTKTPIKVPPIPIGKNGI